jgi:hypothetical protein
LFKTGKNQDHSKGSWKIGEKIKGTLFKKNGGNQNRKPKRAPCLTVNMENMVKFALNVTPKDIGLLYVVHPTTSVIVLREA